MGMSLTPKNAEVAAQILTVFAENECTVAEIRGILSYVCTKTENTATVPKNDYKAEMTEMLNRAGQG